MKTVTYPKGEFTVKDVVNSVKNVTYATVLSKIKDSCAKGELVEVGVKKTTTGPGKPARFYRLA